MRWTQNDVEAIVPRGGLSIDVVGRVDVPDVGLVVLIRRKGLDGWAPGKEKSK